MVDPHFRSVAERVRTLLSKGTSIKMYGMQPEDLEQRVLLT